MTPELGRGPRLAVTDAVGCRLGRFIVKKRLGAGSTGVVYLARDTERDRTVALKLVHPKLAGDAVVVERLQEQARVTQAIESEHIMRVLEVGWLDGAPYLTMEWLDGEPLSERVGRPVGAAMAVHLMRQLCSAMQAAHQHGVVHRDLKPENVYLVIRAGQPEWVKVLDFGLAKVLLKQKPGSPRTLSGQICGTPQYMAPEQCSGGVVDRRTDLYALGLIAYELVTGHVPFDGRNLIEVMVRQRSERPVPPHQVEPSVPRELSDAIMRALEKRPEDRFATAAELAEALLRVRTREGYAVDLPAFVRLEAGASPRPARCTQLLTGGLFVATDGRLPDVGASVQVALKLEGILVEGRCEVTMGVSPAQATAWGTPRGFAAKFTHLEPQGQALIERVLRGDPLPRAQLDAEVQRLNTPQRRDNGAEDLYALLGLPVGADAAAVRRRARECRAKVEDALLGASDDELKARLQRTLLRLEEAWRVLSDPARRVEYDAGRGNFRGIAACLDAGVDPEIVAVCRRRYVEAQPAAVKAAASHAASAAAREEKGELIEALADCELALTLDPLSTELHAKRSLLLSRIQSQAETLSGEWKIQRKVSQSWT